MMMKWSFLLVAMISMITVSCQSDKSTYALITTPYGDMKIRLYNSTPKHRDNFINLTNKKFYDYTLFHRVIKDFVVQGGDPLSKDAHVLDVLGEGGPGYQLDAEIGAIHVKGAVAAARLDDSQNPERKSSGSQFYIVQGKAVTDLELDQWEAQKGIKYTPEQRKLYLEKGGLPFLDMDYTVFGEVVEGLDVIDRMSTVPKGRYDRPTEDQRMIVKIVK
jgi:cyclophilin family peptidyl-prolyl cis-trans isomerase